MKPQTKLYALLLSAACSFHSPKEPLAGRSVVIAAPIEAPVIIKEVRASYQSTVMKGASFSLEATAQPSLEEMEPHAQTEAQQGKPEVLYDCSAYPSTAIDLPTQTSDVLEALLTFWNQDIRQSSERLGDVIGLVPYLLDLNPALLNPKEKIYLQNSLLHFARKASDEERTTLTALAMRFAMTEEALEKIGSEIDPGVFALLGPLDTWTERRWSAKNDVLKHERFVSPGLLQFRPVALPQKRALIAQMIAFDTKGQPHLTPMIAHIEMREGFTADAHACVLEANVAQLRRGAPALRAVAYEEFPVNGGCAFVSSTGDGGLGCKNCHFESSARYSYADVPKEESAAWLSTRQQSSLDFAQKNFSWVTE